MRSSSSVHPHGRGDNPNAATWRVRAGGSPPRAWGQSVSHVKRSTIRRFTPTGVGTICNSGAGGVRIPVHPHGRGDNFTGRSNRGRTYGSPPRAWGQSACRAGYRWRCRFTPTGVGTMSPSSASDSEKPVHPHGRGDNDAGTVGPTPTGGSPPRAWGQCAGGPVAHDQSRFTPTGVGTIRSDR